MAKVKEGGALVELDPKKNYIMLIDASAFTKEEASEVVRMVGRGKNGGIWARGILEGVRFVEYSSNIIGVKYTNDRKPLDNKVVD